MYSIAIKIITVPYSQVRFIYTAHYHHQRVIQSVFTRIKLEEIMLEIKEYIEYIFIYCGFSMDLYSIAVKTITDHYCRVKSRHYCHLKHTHPPYTVHSESKQHGPWWNIQDHGATQKTTSATRQHLVLSANKVYLYSTLLSTTGHSVCFYRNIIYKEENIAVFTAQSLYYLNDCMDGGVKSF